jgi:transporter family-2 protein
MALAGSLIALQAPVNGRLGDAIGGLPAAALSFGIGFVALLALLVVAGKAAALGGLGGVPWWALLGGLLGGAYVYVALSTVGTLGAGGVTAATIAGQLSLAVVVDHFGLVGVDRHPITPARAAGLVLLAAGVALVVRP